MTMALLGAFLVAGYYLWRGLVYLRWSRRGRGETGMELAEDLLRRNLTGFRARIGWRNGTSYRDRAVELTAGVARGRSLYHLAVAAHEVGHALQWRAWEDRVRAVQGVLTLAVGFLILGVLLGVDKGAPFVVAGYGLFLASLPLELDANRRALEALRGLLSEEELEAVREVMAAHTLSYVAVPLGGMLIVWGWLSA